MAVGVRGARPDSTCRQDEFAHVEQVVAHEELHEQRMFGPVDVDQLLLLGNVVEENRRLAAFRTRYRPAPNIIGGSVQVPLRVLRMDGQRPVVLALVLLHLPGAEIHGRILALPNLRCNDIENPHNTLLKIMPLVITVHGK